MKKVFCLLVICLLLFGCGKRQEDIKKEYSFNIGYSTNLLNKSDREDIKEIFEDNNLSNIDLFFNLLDDYNKEEDLGCNLNDYMETSKVNYDEVKCIDRYEKNHEVSDGNCRLTAFALIQGKLKIKEKQQNYGTYLMFDLDVLENNNDYKVVNDHFDEFVTLYDEMDVSKVKKEYLENVYTNKWNDYGISIDNGNVSLISVVMHDEYDDVLFVGHTGILIKLDDKYLFVEKLAFEMPYQITVIKSPQDLKEIFSKRANYFSFEGANGPYVYQNDKLIFSY